MKKLSILLICLIIFTSFSLGNASAGITLKIDGEKINYNPAPFVDSKTNRTLVPLRLIAEKMGAVVNWNGEFKLITIDLRRTTVTIKVGNSFAYVNSTEKKLEQPAIIVKDRTFVPLRFVSEALGAKVDWDEITNTINIGTGKIPPGAFIEPKFEIEYTEGDFDPQYFRIILKNGGFYPDDQFQVKVHIDNYPQLNGFEQPSLITANKWDYAKKDGWKNIFNNTEEIYGLNKEYYATRDDMKNLKLTSGMKIEFTISLKQISTGIIKEYKDAAVLR